MAFFRAVRAVVKYSLAALGAALCFGLALQEVGEHRLGLGTGIAVAMFFAVIKGVIMAVQGSDGPTAPSHQHQTDSE